MRMTSALQVVICLCLLGLSIAAPQARNIRWCVTSDIEDKKCKDLVNSCSVNEILLICVKKSSTEDCMRAISNGEADAVSLDGADLYKASVNPFNLKPILAESYSKRANEKPCLKERQKALGAEKPSLGAFVPDCDEKGNYSPKQCHGSTGYCWCVTENGEEISGSRTSPGQQHPTCGASAETPCLKERQKKLGAGRPLLGAFVPDCDEKGNYSPKQCHGSTGYCWCVNKEGTEISGTKTAPGQPSPACEDQTNEKPCLKERQKVLGAKQPSLGAFLPDCDEKGNYSPKQCHGSTGYCWCVTENGEEISGSRTSPGQQHPTCGASAETPCLKERQKKLGAGRPLLGAFVPDCDEKGNYSPKQCHGSTGYCWCVNKEGTEISGTKTAPGQPSPACEDQTNEKPCLKERQKVLGAKQPSLGAFLPDCDEKGNYSPKQCHGSTGYCWCVTENGEEISGSRTSPGQQHPTCGASAETPCLKERQKKLGAGQPLRGAFVPDCDEKGNYSPKQCHGSTGYCWCVNKEGTEISGTKTAPGQPSPACEDQTNEKHCLKERQKVLGAKQPSLGAFLPDCDEKGNYSPKQCHGSTGYCWCVTENGEEISGSRTSPGQQHPTCGASAETPCLKERQKMLGAGQPLPGAFVPDCDEKGNYSPKQCHGSTGYCWCVNKEGTEISGTKTAPGQPSPACEDQKSTPCLKHRQGVLDGKKPRKGAFVPKCDEKGDYVPKQCHGSTGHCWCVNTDGEEIQGTRVRPGIGQIACAHTANEKPCLKERQKVLGAEQPLRGAFVPDCDEKGNYSPKQCHGSTGHCWCVNTDGEEIQGTRVRPGVGQIACAHTANEKPCLKERQKVLGAEQPSLGAFVPDCDEKGNYSPKQCHGSTGDCWCVNTDGEEIQGTRVRPGIGQIGCAHTANEKPCLKERQKVLGAEQPLLGAFAPDCDEKGNYSPKQCHGSTGYCWCVTENGEEISGSRTPPGQPHPTCGASAETPCLKERQKMLGAGRPLLGAFVPDCDEKGNYSPKQCHGSTGYCWCVTRNGKEIVGTRTAPGHSAPTCEVTDPVTLHYAVAVVKKSSTLQFDQLKGKRSCHSAVGETAGWIIPLNTLRKKNLLLWEGLEKKSIEKAASEFFSASCAPGAKEENLCKQCAGQKDKCKRSPGEPYYGDDGAFRCLRDDKGDVAFVEDIALSGQYSDNFELLCPDNTRKPLDQYKECNLGNVPTHAVVTRSTGDKTKDITDYLHKAQENKCKLFSSSHGKDLLFEDKTTSFIALPSVMDSFMFLGSELFNAVKTLQGEHFPSNNEVRWCTQSANEKKKCDDWSAVSGGSIKCTEPTTAQKCIEKVLKGEAEAATISQEHMYTALKCGLVPAVEEYHNKDDFTPCQTRGAPYTDFGTLSAVAVVKKRDGDITWNNLKGKKSCHTGVGHTAGWTIPVSLISKRTTNCDIGTYFSQSCAPGSAKDSNLCKLCIGDPQNTKANTKCSPSDKEAYYGNQGAIRCLVEKGDVAFVPHTAVFENTDGKNPALWAKDLKSSDFELLCPDGSRASVSDYKKCKLTGIPPRAVITRPESLSNVVRIIINQQSLYGRKGFEKDMFQMFSSSYGQNLLFSDGTQCLIEFDRKIEKDILEDYFGKPFYTAVYSDNHCVPISELASACTFHHS